jgi:uncharacterized membrane protein
MDLPSHRVRLQYIFVRSDKASTCNEARSVAVAAERKFSQRVVGVIMKDQVWTVLLVLAAVGAGLNGGLFFIFSNTIMRSLDRLPAAGAVAAMNSINAVILNPLFFLAFFGTGLLCLVLLVGQLDSPLVVVGALFFLVGSLGITMICNVPLNDKLAKVLPSANDMETQWSAYREPWTRWNHVRTVACLLAAAAFTLEVSR